MCQGLFVWKPLEVGYEGGADYWFRSQEDLRPPSTSTFNCAQGQTISSLSHVSVFVHFPRSYHMQRAEGYSVRKGLMPCLDSWTGCRSWSPRAPTQGGQVQVSNCLPVSHETQTMPKLKALLVLHWVLPPVPRVFLCQRASQLRVLFFPLCPRQWWLKRLCRSSVCLRGPCWT